LMRNNEDVVRYMTIKLDAATTGPSAIIAKHDNDDRFESQNEVA